MTIARGGWIVDEAVLNQWRLKHLDQLVRNQWPNRSNVQYEPFNYGEARPVPPGCYVVYERSPSSVIARMSSSGLEQKQLIEHAIEFRVHAKSRTKYNFNESAKSVCKKIAKAIAEAYDPHNILIVPDGQCHAQTYRDGDWCEREGDEEWVWHLRYRIVVAGSVDLIEREEESTSSTTFSASTSSSYSTSCTSHSSISGSSSSTVRYTSSCSTPSSQSTWSSSSTQARTSSSTVEKSSSSECSTDSSSSSSSSNTHSSSSCSSPAAEEAVADMILDCEDIGCVYDDSSTVTRAANTAAIRAYITSRAGSGVALSVIGPRRSSTTGREPATLHLDGSDASPAFDIDAQSFHLFGVAGSKIRSHGGSAAEVPVIQLANSGENYRMIVEGLEIESDASCIKCDATGSQVMCKRLLLRPKGSGTATVDSFDDITFTEVQDPTTTASYGMWINNSDGTIAEDIRILDPQNHGVIATRWHDGRGHFTQIHDSVAGCGFKGERVNGCQIKIRAESNYGYGLYLLRCGTPDGATALTLSGASSSQAGEWHVWLENNNQRNNDAIMGGSGNRELKLDTCARQRIFGNSRWAYNLVHVSQGGRSLNELVDAMYLPLSGTPVKDIDDLVDDSGFTDNRTAAWSNAAYHPTITLESDGADGKQIVIDIPAGAYSVGGVATASTTAWFRPFGNQPFTSTEGQVVAQTLTIAGNANMVAYCAGCEPGGESGNNVLAHVGNVQLSQSNSSVSLSERFTGLVYLAFWNVNTRKIYSNIYRQSVSPGTQGYVIPHLVLWTSGMGGGQSGTVPANTIRMTISNWQVYEY